MYNLYDHAGTEHERTSQSSVPLPIPFWQAVAMLFAFENTVCACTIWEASTLAASAYLVE